MEQKKFRPGYLFAAIGAAISCFALQLILGIAYLLVVAIITMTQYQIGHPGAGQEELMQVYYDAIQGNGAGSVLIYHVFSLPLFGLWYYLGCGRRKLSQSARNMTGKAVAIAVLGGFLLCLFANGIVGVEAYVIPSVVEAYADMMENAGMGVDALAIFASVVLAPVGEEFLCRGIMLYYGKKAFPRFWCANLLQAFLFGCIHGNLIQGGYAFVIGLMLGYLAERYHSLIPCIILHFVVNFTSTFLIDKVLSPLPDVFLSYLLLAVIPAVLLVLLVKWGGRVRSGESS